MRIRLRIRASSDLGHFSELRARNGMGQVIGKATIDPSAAPFVGLPRRAITDLFDAYHSVAEGYGVTLAEFADIVALSVGEYLPLACSTETKTKTQRIASLATALFVLLDDDKNALVDAFEFLSILVLLSACTTKEKICFVLRLYEFDDPNRLTAEEAILAVRAAVLGLDKVTKTAEETRTRNEETKESSKETQKIINRLALAAFLPPLAEDGMRIHGGTFDDTVIKLMNNGTTISKEEFISHIITSPEVVSWIRHVDCCCEEQNSGRRADRFLSAAAADDDDMDSAIKSTATLRLLHSRLSQTGLADIDHAVTNSSSLRLDWIYGRNVDTCGNGAIYLNQKQVVYLAGAVVVKATYSEDVGTDDDANIDIGGSPSIRQEYFTEHSMGGHVTALAVHTSSASSGGGNNGNGGVSSSDSLVATANIETDESLSSIKVWSARTMKSVVTIPVPNVCMLKFSPCGVMLLAVALGTDHDHISHISTVTVCKWRERKIVYSGASTGRPVYDCSFLAGGRFGLAGDGFVHFWSPRGDAKADATSDENQAYERQVGVFGRVKSSEIMTCISSLVDIGKSDGGGDLAVTGSTDGNLCLWEGRCCVQYTPVGTCGSITRLHVPPRGENNTSGIVLCVGTSDGRIHLFGKAMSSDSVSASYDSIDNVLELIMSLSIASLGINSCNPLNQFCIDSLCLVPRSDDSSSGKERAKLLVGLRSSDLFEMDLEARRVTRGITQCHGDGGSTTSCSMIRSTPSSTGGSGQCKSENTIARLSCLAINPNDAANELLTTGSDGLLCQWNVSSRRPKRTIVLQAPASCVCYSAKGSRIYVGFAGTATEKAGSHVVLSAKDLTVLRGSRHSQQELTDCKASLDGRYYAFASKDSDIYVYDAHTDKLLHKLRGHNDAVVKISFSQTSCTGHQRDEIRDANSTISDLEPPPTFLRSRSSSGEVLFWSLKTGKKCTYSSQQKTIWSTDSQVNRRYIHTIGSGNIHCCLFQWRVLENGQHGDFPKADSRLSPPLLSPKLVGADDTDSSTSQNAADAPQQCRATNIVAAGTCSGGTPQWRRVIVPLSKSIDSAEATIHRDLPRSELELEFVQGFSAGTAGSRSLFYANNDGGTSLIYPVGRILVRSIHNRSKGQGVSQQIFHQECASKINNVAEHPSLPLCAVSNDSDDTPAIHIVDYRQRRRMMNTVQIFHLESPCKTNCLRFDKSGQYLVAICQDKVGTESLLVVDWKSNACIASVSATTIKQQTKDVAFLPDGSGLIQCGASVLTFWSWSGGGSLVAVPLVDFGVTFSASGSKGRCGSSTDTDCIYHSIGFIGNESVVGTDDGCLLLFNHEYTLDATIKAHSSAVMVISSSSNCGIASGCSDGIIKIWKPSHKSLCCISSFDVVSLGIASLRSSVTNLCFDDTEDRLLIGTARNEICEVQLPSSSSSCLRSTGDEDTNRCNATIEANVIVQGHCGNKPIALSINPRMATYATVAGDSVLRVWEIHGQKLLRSRPIEMAARACAHSPDGAYIAIGFGAETKQSAAELHGKVSFFRESDLGIEFELRDARKMITEIKWSIEGTMLAVGSSDTCIYLYSVRTGCDDPGDQCDDGDQISTTSTSSPSRLMSAQLVRKIDNAFTSSITSIDFSTDGRYIQATCASNTLAWFDTTNGSQILQPSSIRDVTWATQTGTVGWGLQGLWDDTTSSACGCRCQCCCGSGNAGLSGSEMHLQSPTATPTPTTADCTLDSTLTGYEIVVSGDTAGKISLRRYPSVPPTTEGSGKVFDAHCGPVSKARFIGNASYLVTVGEVDQTVLVWRHVIDDGKHTWHERSDDEAQQDKEGDTLPSKAPTSTNCRCREDGASPLSADAKKRAWMRSCIEQSSSPDNKTIKDEMPAMHLNLTLVHGVSSARCFASYNCNGGVVYSASGLGITYDKNNDEQRFFAGHRGDITALAVSSASGGQLVVTGDDAHCPTVRVWNGDTCQELCCLQPIFSSSNQNLAQQQIEFVAFSSDAKQILAVGRAQGAINDAATSSCRNTLFLWASFSGQWKGDVDLQAKANCGNEPIDFAFFFGPEYMKSSVELGVDSVAETKFDLVTGGRNHLNLWTRQGSHLSQTRGVFRSSKDVQTMHCGALVRGEFFLTGAESGDIYLWKGSSMISSSKAHTPHRVNCIQVSECQRFLATGGNDGSVKVWRIKSLPPFDGSDDSKEHSPLVVAQASVDVGAPVRSIAIDPHLFHPSRGIRRVLAVTDAGKLCEVSTESENLLTIQRGHASSSAIDAGPAELWGLATYPTNADKYVTVGDDGVLRLWSIQDQKQTKEVSLGLPARAVCVSSDGKTILIGCGNGIARNVSNGTFLLLNATLQVLFKRQDTSAWICQAAFSPNDEMFALAAADKKIYIYENDASKRYRLKCTLHSHIAPITSLDFSSDGLYIQSTSEGELLVHNTECGDLMGLPSQLKSIKWSTFTSSYGWPVQGLWPKTSEAGGGTCKATAYMYKHDEPMSVDRSRDGKYLVVCGTSGRVELFHYPVPTRPKYLASACALDNDFDANGRLGHSPGRIVRCRFSCDGKHVITIGREDCAVMVWAVE